MGFIAKALEFFLHIDIYLSLIIQIFGYWTYLIVFFIIFFETGLVFTPFLPGDSLIFAVGTFAGVGLLNVFWLFFLISLAAIIGDSVNYWIGHYFGARILLKYENRLIKKEHLEKTHHFFEKYGGKTIIIARFIPIVRTIAPFIAGVGQMTYRRFFSYNVIGGLLWVILYLFGGYFFGNLPVIKKNFTLVIYIIIVSSILPALWEFFKHKILKKKNNGQA